MQTIKQRAALSQRYDMNPDHFRFPRQQTAAMRHAKWVTQDRVTLKEALGWIAAFVGLCLMSWAALAVGV